jgi:hypothetical protein
MPGRTKENNRNLKRIGVPAEIQRWPLPYKPDNF